MNTESLLLHKAHVHTADSVTGECTVRIPTLMGGQIVTIGNEGLTKTGPLWNVPAVGAVVSVSSTSDMRLFSWVVDPNSALASAVVGPDPFPQYATDVDMAAAIAAAVASIANKLVPAGTVHATVGATADIGYLLIDGSTVVNAQTIHPAMWLRIPASWKVGADMVMPDWRSRMLVMDDSGATFTLGGTAGSMAKTIASGNLPRHTHTMDHAHSASGSSSGINLAHNHSYSTTTSTDGSHVHTFSNNPDPTHTVGIMLAANAPSSYTLGNGGTLQVYATSTTPPIIDSSGSHNHSLSGTTTSDGGLGTFTPSISVTVNATSGLFTGDGGYANTALDVTPAVGVVNFQIKAH